MFTNENCAILLTSHLTATNSSGKYDAVFAIDAADGNAISLKRYSSPDVWRVEHRFSKIFGEYE